MTQLIKIYNSKTQNTVVNDNDKPKNKAVDFSDFVHRNFIVYRERRKQYIRDLNSLNNKLTEGQKQVAWFPSNNLHESMITKFSTISNTAGHH